MPDNWGYVATAYALAGLLLGAYWRYLVRRSCELARPQAPRRLRGLARSSPAAGLPPSRP